MEDQLKILSHNMQKYFPIWYIERYYKFLFFHGKEGRNCSEIIMFEHITVFILAKYIYSKGSLILPFFILAARVPKQKYHSGQFKGI